MAYFATSQSSKGVPTDPSALTAFQKLLPKLEDITFRSRESSISIAKIKEFKTIYLKLIKNYRAIMGGVKLNPNLPEAFFNLTQAASLKKIEDCFTGYLELPPRKNNTL